MNLQPPNVDEGRGEEAWVIEGGVGVDEHPRQVPNERRGPGTRRQVAPDLVPRHQELHLIS